MGSCAGRRGGKLDGGAEKQHASEGGVPLGQVPPEKARWEPRWWPHGAHCPAPAATGSVSQEGGAVLFFIKLHRLLRNKLMRG